MPPGTGRTRPNKVVRNVERPDREADPTRVGGGVRRGAQSDRSALERPIDVSLTPDSNSLMRNGESGFTRSATEKRARELIQPSELMTPTHLGKSLAFQNREGFKLKLRAPKEKHASKTRPKTGDTPTEPTQMERRRSGAFQILIRIFDQVLSQIKKGRRSTVKTSTGVDTIPHLSAKPEEVTRVRGKVGTPSSIAENLHITHERAIRLMQSADGLIYQWAPYMSIEGRNFQNPTGSVLTELAQKKFLGHELSDRASKAWEALIEISRSRPLLQKKLGLLIRESAVDSLEPKKLEELRRELDHLEGLLETVREWERVWQSTEAIGFMNYVSLQELVAVPAMGTVDQGRLTGDLLKDQVKNVEMFNPDSLNQFQNSAHGLIHLSGRINLQLKPGESVEQAILTVQDNLQHTRLTAQRQAIQMAAWAALKEHVQKIQQHWQEMGLDPEIQRNGVWENFERLAQEELAKLPQDPSSIEVFTAVHQIVDGTLSRSGILPEANITDQFLHGALLPKINLEKSLIPTKAGSMGRLVFETSDGKGTVRQFEVLVYETLTTEALIKNYGAEITYMANTQTPFAASAKIAAHALNRWKALKAELDQTPKSDTQKREDLTKAMAQLLPAIHQYRMDRFLIGAKLRQAYLDPVNPKGPSPYQEVQGFFQQTLPGSRIPRIHRDLFNPEETSHIQLSQKYPIEIRLKDPNDIAAKIRRRGWQHLAPFTDILGARIVVQSPYDIPSVVHYLTHEAKDAEGKPMFRLREIYDQAGNKTQEIDRDKMNRVIWGHRKRGYRGMHLVLERNGLPFEVQIHTEAQYAWGVLQHDVTYKNGKSLSPVEFGNVERFFLDASDFLAGREQGAVPEKIPLSPVVADPLVQRALGETVGLMESYFGIGLMEKVISLHRKAKSLPQESQPSVTEEVYDNAAQGPHREKEK